MTSNPTWIPVGAGKLALWHRPNRQYLRDMATQGLGADLVIVTLLHSGEDVKKLAASSRAGGFTWV